MDAVKHLAPTLVQCSDSVCVFDEVFDPDDKNDDDVKTMLAIAVTMMTTTTTAALESKRVYPVPSLWLSESRCWQDQRSEARHKRLKARPDLVLEVTSSKADACIVLETSPEAQRGAKRRQGKHADRRQSRASCWQA